MATSPRKQSRKNTDTAANARREKAFHDKPTPKPSPKSTTSLKHSPTRMSDSEVKALTSKSYRPPSKSNVSPKDAASASKARAPKKRSK